MSDVEQNKKIVAETLGGLASGDPFKYISDDVRYTIPGTTRFSGTYQGKQEVIERLFGPLSAEIETFGSAEILNLIAEGDYVVVESTSVDRRTRSGKDYNNTYCIVCRLLDGKIVEVHEYMDTEMVTDVFGR